MGEELCYVAIRPCGCCTAVSVIEPEMAQANAEFVKRCTKSGRKVEIKSSAWARANLRQCECGKQLELQP